MQQGRLVNSINEAYHLYLTNRQLQKVRALGFDFSFLRVEASIWTDIEAAAKERNPNKVRRALASFEKEFRLFINSTCQGVVKAKAKLLNAKLEGVDVAAWQKLILKVDELSQNIFVEMKARERSALGCHFHEHDWIPRSLLSVRMELYTPDSCCRFFVTKMSLECRNCRYLVHPARECKLLALQTPCKSVIEGQDAASTVKLRPIKNMVDMNKAVYDEILKFQEHQDIITASYLASLAYDDNAKPDDDLVIHEVGKIKFLISTVGESKFVVVRGTIPTSLSNWITNSSALLKAIMVGTEAVCHAHSGFLAACESIYSIVWNHLNKTTTKRVIFGGHSLGGAVAHAIHLKSLLEGNLKNIAAMSVGFGSPLVFDNLTENAIIAHAGNPSDFVTFVNQFDPVPSIIQTIGSGKLRDVLAKTIAPGVATTLVGVISREITKNYSALGRYVFFDSGGNWESNSVDVIMDRLKQNNNHANVDHHDMAVYHSSLVIYLESLENLHEPMID